MRFLIQYAKIIANLPMTAGVSLVLAGSGEAAETKDNIAAPWESGASRHIVSNDERSSKIRSSSYLLMPVDAVGEQPAIKSGCWARVYDDRNFSGGALTLSGPLAMPTMLGPFGINWKNRVRSIELGKNAIVTVYDNVDFRQQIASFEPGERVPDLRKNMGYFDDFSSLKISCKT